MGHTVVKLGYDVFLGGGIGLVEESGADVLVVRKGKGKGHKGFGKRGREWSFLLMWVLSWKGTASICRWRMGDIRGSAVWRE